MTRPILGPIQSLLAAISLSGLLGCAGSSPAPEAAAAAASGSPAAYTCTVIARAGQMKEELYRDTFEITDEMIGDNTAVNACLALAYFKPPPGATAFECTCEALPAAD